MSLIKSFAVGNGDMFYIRHGSDNFTIIDCHMTADIRKAILDELKTQSKDKGVVRFISTHPDDDHLAGLVELDDAMGLRNFYRVKNQATKIISTDAFERYCELRDDADKAFYIERGSTRKWMNKGDETRGQAGIEVLWPITTNPEFKAELECARTGGSPNNISCIVKYSLNKWRFDGVDGRLGDVVHGERAGRGSPAGDRRSVRSSPRTELRQSAAEVARRDEPQHRHPR